MKSELRELDSMDSTSSKQECPLLNLETEGDAVFDDLDEKFAPFARRDVYGPMGLGPFPLTEMVKLAVAMVTLVPIRFVLGISVVVMYYFICRVCTVFSAPNRGKEEGEGEGEGVVQEDYAHLGGWRRAMVVKCGRFFSRVLLFVFGFYQIGETFRDLDSISNQKNTATTKQNGQKDHSEEPERPGVIISNHVSYMDILYHMSSSFPSFVAKRSVGKLPLVGLISKCLGCVYVQREAKSPDFRGVSGTVNERVREAHQSKTAPTMMLFPEGTTTNGDYLLPFKTGAFLAGTPVLPVILRYPYSRFSPAWDSMSGVRHLIFLLCQFSNHIEAIRLPVYCPSQLEKDDPKLYASNVRRLMAKEGNLILSDMGLGDKRIYHATLNGILNNPRTVLDQKED